MENFIPKKGSIVVYVKTHLITASEDSYASLPIHYHIGIIGQISASEDKVKMDFGNFGIDENIDTNKIQPLRVNKALLEAIGFNSMKSDILRMTKLGYPFFIALKGDESDIVVSSLNGAEEYRIRYFDELLDIVPNLREYLPTIIGKEAINGHIIY